MNNDKEMRHCPFCGSEAEMPLAKSKMKKDGSWEDYTVTVKAKLYGPDGVIAVHRDNEAPETENPEMEDVSIYTDEGYARFTLDSMEPKDARAIAEGLSCLMDGVTRETVGEFVKQHKKEMIAIRDAFEKEFKFCAEVEFGSKFMILIKAYSEEGAMRIAKRIEANKDDFFDEYEFYIIKNASILNLEISPNRDASVSETGGE